MLFNTRENILGVQNDVMGGTHVGGLILSRFRSEGNGVGGI